MAVRVSIEVTIPDRIINDAAVRAEIKKAIKQKTAPDLRRTFKQTVAGWKRPPSFSQRFSNRANSLAVTVFASGARKNQYAIVNFGSPSHRITPKRGGLLRFRPGYRAATRPRVLSSRTKQRSGSFVTAGSVMHPGFQAREFDITVGKDVEPRFESHVQNAIRIGADRP